MVMRRRATCADSSCSCSGCPSISTLHHAVSASPALPITATAFSALPPIHRCTPGAAATTSTAGAADGDTDESDIVCRCTKLPSLYLIHARAPLAPPPPIPPAAAVAAAASSVCDHLPGHLVQEVSVERRFWI
uniref:Uncharacterized protein n=1 Tax=Oryza brachyantha TaxID=4533 RepID=J3N7Q7_ORYBR